MSFFFQPPIFALQQQRPPPRYLCYVQNTWTPIIQPVIMTTATLSTTVLTPTVAVPVLIPLPPLIVSSAPGTSATSCLQTPAINMRIVFFTQHPSLKLFATDASYHAPPSKEKLLADVTRWARLHGLPQTQQIQAAKMKLYNLPAGGGENRAPLGVSVLPDVGPVMPGDVVHVLGLENVQEGEMKDVMEDVRRRGYEAVLVVDTDADADADTDAVDAEGGEEGDGDGGDQGQDDSGAGAS